MTTARVYLDWNAAAPLRPEARAAMLAAMDAVGNPSAAHAEGRAARAIVEQARVQLARLVGVAPDEIIFTSGATEAAALVGRMGWSRVAASAVEHDAVRAQADLTLDAVRADGRVDAARLDPGALSEAGGAPGRGLLCLCAASGETGVVQPVAEAAERLGRRAGGDWRLLCDATQAIGKQPFSARDLAIDYAILSAHKFGGPKGVGAVAADPAAVYAPLLTGGGQERGFRSGTENVAAIAGAGAAADAALRDLERGVWDAAAERRDRLEAALRDAAPDVIVFGADAPRLPNTLHFAAPGWRGETQVMLMDLAGFAVSAGSACSSGKLRASPVLEAMGVAPAAAASALRVSIGPATTDAEIDAFAAAWIDAYRRWRARRRA